MRTFSHLAEDLICGQQGRAWGHARAFGRRKRLAACKFEALTARGEVLAQVERVVAILRTVACLCHWAVDEGVESLRKQGAGHLPGRRRATAGWAFPECTRG
jgi:hypothetical protein